MFRVSSKKSNDNALSVHRAQLFGLAIRLPCPEYIDKAAGLRTSDADVAVRELTCSLLNCTCHCFSNNAL